MQVTPDCLQALRILALLHIVSSRGATSLRKRTERGIDLQTDNGDQLYATELLSKETPLNGSSKRVGSNTRRPPEIGAGSSSPQPARRSSLLSSQLASKIYEKGKVDRPNPEETVNEIDFNTSLDSAPAHLGGEDAVGFLDRRDSASFPTEEVSGGRFDQESALPSISDGGTEGDGVVDQHGALSSMGQDLLPRSLLCWNFFSSGKSFADQALKSHNYYRGLHGAPPLKLDSTVSAWAQDWANQLINIGGLQHRQPNKYGENLHWHPISDCDGNEPVDGFYAEEQYYTYGYDPDRSTFNKVGHFTQLVWHGSKRVGVGVGKSCGSLYIVFNYDPPGNVRGYYGQQVKRRINPQAPLNPPTFASKKKQQSSRPGTYTYGEVIYQPGDLFGLPQDMTEFFRDLGVPNQPKKRTTPRKPSRTPSGFSRSGRRSWRSKSLRELSTDAGKKIKSWAGKTCGSESGDGKVRTEWSRSSSRPGPGSGFSDFGEWPPRGFGFGKWPPPGFSFPPEFAQMSTLSDNPARSRRQIRLDSVGLRK